MPHHILQRLHKPSPFRRIPSLQGHYKRTVRSEEVSAPQRFAFSGKVVQQPDAPAPLPVARFERRIAIRAAFKHGHELLDDAVDDDAEHGVPDEELRGLVAGEVVGPLEGVGGV